MTEIEHAKDIIKGFQKCYYCKYRIDSSCSYGGIYNTIHSFNNSCEHFEDDDYYIESNIVNNKEN